MTSLSTQYSGSATNRVLTPRQLPISTGPLSVKTGNNVSLTPNDPTLYDLLATQGASSAIVSADSWETITQIVGSGVLFNVLAPHANDLSNVSSIRITIDGVSYEFQHKNSATNGALMVGCFLPCFSVNSANPGGMPGSYLDAGWLGKTTSEQYHNAQRLILPIEVAESMGMVGVDFQQSLQVEVKASIYSQTSAGDKAAAIYKVY